jgi:multicomponent Na+:H+ antiporter subunit G
MISDVIVVILLMAGCVFFAAGTVGLLRFPDLDSRLHALTKADNLGLGFVAAGLIVHAADPAVAVKLVLIWALALVAAATSAHLLARGPDGPERPP